MDTSTRLSAATPPPVGRESDPPTVTVIIDPPHINPRNSQYTRLEFTDIVLEPWCYPVIAWDEVKPRYDHIKDSWVKTVAERIDRVSFELSILEARVKFLRWERGLAWL